MADTTTLTSAILTTRMRHTYTNGLDGRNVQDILDKTLTTTLVDGTTTGKAQEVYYDERTLTTTAGEDLDLELMSGAFGDIVFAKIKLLVINVLTATSGYRLEIGGAASEAWEQFVKTTGDIVKADAGGCVVLYNSPVDGGTVDGTHHNLKVYNPSGGSVTYQIWIVGTGELA
jgi:hypothetical protein